jgi:hypothetical protein
MPCRDYSDDYRVVDNTQTYKAMRDKLARIACKAMTQLEKVDPENKLFKNAEAKEWWAQHKIADAKAAEERRKAADAKKAKAAALAKLTDADKKALGLN